MPSGSPLPDYRDIPANRERRKRPRHRAQTPAFVGMNGNSTGINLDLHQIIDLSEEGMAFQSSGPMDIGETLDFSVDLSEPKTYFHAVGRVMWSNPSGRTGIRFQKTAPADVVKLREWLSANAAPEAPIEAPRQEMQVSAAPLPQEPPIPVQKPAAPARTNVSELFAIEALKLEIESLAFDLDSALQIVVQRALSLTCATGAAIALSDGAEMVCRATSGPDAPPVGSRLQVGSGFSGECIRSGQLLHCDDSELDERVDRESCRALDIRSIMAAPIHQEKSVAGLIEIFSPDAGAFGPGEKTVLVGMANIVADAIARSSRGIAASTSVPTLVSAQAEHAGVSEAAQQRDTDELVRSLAEAHTRLAIAEAAQAAVPKQKYQVPWIPLVILAAAILAIVWLVLSGLGSKTPGLQRALGADRGGETIKRASLAGNSLQELTKLASQGDAMAAFTLGLRYATGSDAPQDYPQAVRWFSSAAEHGHVMAQSTLGAYYWAGRGVPQDLRKAYFWALLAQSAGDDASRARLPFLVSRLNRDDIIEVQREADGWMREHQTRAKPSPAQP